MRPLINYFFIAALIVLFYACEKNRTYEDKFNVTVTENTTVPGSSIAYSTSDNSFVLKYSPWGTETKAVSIIDEEDGIWTGETEVTYNLWKEIYNWAVKNGYSKLSEGQSGSDVSFNDNHPVTCVSWCDAVVWCNALTEYYNLYNGDKPDYTFAYTYNGSVLKDASLTSAESENVVYDSYATGFRIPLNSEWYAAASYKNTPSGYASGASASFESEKANVVVAWYRINSDMKTHEVAQKLPNLLGLYDMSGNVSEIVYDRRAFGNAHYNIRGGAWNSNPEEIQIGEHHPVDARTSSYSVGVRLVRTQGEDFHAQIETVNNEEVAENGAGEGSGKLKFDGIEYTISKAILFNYTSIGSPAIEIEFLSSEISMKKENNGGYTGTGILAEFSIITQNGNLSDGTHYSEDDIMAMSVLTNCNTDVFPYEYEKSFVGGSSSDISVSLDGDQYTITFQCNGMVLPSGNDAELTGTYTGTIVKLDAGFDF